MQRRNFLLSLLAAAALDPERLLWTPGAKTISIPAPPKIVEVTDLQKHICLVMEVSEKAYKACAAKYAPRV